MIAIRPARRSDAGACAPLILEPPGGLTDVFRGDRRVAVRVARAAFVARGTALSHDRSLVAEEGRLVVGSMARFPGALWPRLRVATGLAMLRGAGPRAWELLWRGPLLDGEHAPTPVDALYVMSLAVLPGARDRGIGARLLAGAVEEARETGLRAVALDVAAENRRAIAFYRRHGFVEVDRRERPPGRGMPAACGIRLEVGVG